MNSRMLFFFFNDTATTEIYTLPLHDALPIYPHHLAGESGRSPCLHHLRRLAGPCRRGSGVCRKSRTESQDRKSTRLNSSHANISYAVFCLKKKKKQY